MGRAEVKRGSLKGIDFFQVLNTQEFETCEWGVLFHGFGASAEDLLPLHEELDPKGRRNWIFPQGPLRIPLGGFGYGHAWWTINLLAYQSAVEAGDFTQISARCPQELPPYRSRLPEWLEGVGVPLDRTYLGGFSQGSMLALDLGLHGATAPKGLLLFSSTLICEKDWREAAPKRTALSFFQSHGRQDGILDYGQAQRLYQLLRESGLQGAFHTFSGGHEIPSSAIEAAKAYLKFNLSLRA